MLPRGGDYVESVEHVFAGVRLGLKKNQRPKGPST